MLIKTKLVVLNHLSYFELTVTLKYARNCRNILVCFTTLICVRKQKSREVVFPKNTSRPHVTSTIPNEEEKFLDLTTNECE